MAATGSGLQLLEERLSKGAQATDWAALIALIIPLIQSCLNPPKPETLRNPPRGTRARLGAAIRRDTGRTWAESFAQADAILRLADEATDGELQSLIEDCCA